MQVTSKDRQLIDCVYSHIQVRKPSSNPTFDWRACLSVTNVKPQLWHTTPARDAILRPPTPTFITATVVGAFSPELNPEVENMTSNPIS